MEGANESTELRRHPYFLFLFRFNLISLFFSLLLYLIFLLLFEGHFCHPLPNLFFHRNELVQGKWYVSGCRTVGRVVASEYQTSSVRNQSSATIYKEHIC